MPGKSNHRGFGHIRKLPSGRYQASYVGPDLGRHRAGSTFTTKGDAEAWLGREQGLIAGGLWTPPALRNAPVAAPVTFGEYAAQWIAHRGLKPRTIHHYEQLLTSRILPTFATVPVESITPAAVAAWHRTLSPSQPTIRAHAYSLLRAICATAVADDILAAQPCRVRGAGNAKRVGATEPPTLAELQVLLEHLPEKYRALVLLGAWLGLRYGEATELRRRDMDLKTGVVNIGRAVVWVAGKPIIGVPKSDAGVRKVTLPPHVVPAIRDHIAHHAAWGPDGLLFPAANGGHLSTSTFYASYWPARKAAGRPDLRFHDLRHLSATLLAISGATTKELMRRLGHSTAQASLIYQHALEGRDAQLAVALSALAEVSST